MSSADGRDGRDGSHKQTASIDPSLETMLFDSLVHHLIGKGLLTKNDALSVVQTVAEVKRAQAINSDASTGELAVLQRLFDSFAAMREGPRARGADGHNIIQLRPPLHSEDPVFPDED